MKRICVILTACLLLTLLLFKLSLLSGTKRTACRDSGLLLRLSIGDGLLYFGLRYRLCLRLLPLRIRIAKPLSLLIHIIKLLSEGIFLRSVFLIRIASLRSIGSARLLSLILETRRCALLRSLILHGSLLSRLHILGRSALFLRSCGSHFDFGLRCRLCFGSCLGRFRYCLRSLCGLFLRSARGYLGSSVGIRFDILYLMGYRHMLNENFKFIELNGSAALFLHSELLENIEEILCFYVEIF